MSSKISKFALLAILGIAILIGCSQDSAEKIRYDMEKLVYSAGRLAERLNVQPELMTAEDSLLFKQAFQNILDYYFQKREDSLVRAHEDVLTQMDKMAIIAQTQLARYYLSHRQYDSVIAAYRRIGTVIPADREDLAGANFRLALTYRSLNYIDSTIAIYDRILSDFYPPIDSLKRVNTDIISLPVDKIIIARNKEDETQAKKYSREALDYFRKLSDGYKDAPLGRAATIYSARVHAMNAEWDAAIDKLRQVKDSTGQIEVRALLLIANIYNDSKGELDQAINLYRQVLDREPDSTVIGTAMLRLGAALCAKKEYEEGRMILADLKKKFERYETLTAKAQLFYAQAFEQDNRWDRALSEYQWLMENYPLSEEAFRAAWHIPEHFTAENDEKLSSIWYERAIEFYEDAIVRKPNQPVAVAAGMFLADTYLRLEDWNKVIDTYERIYSMIPKSRTGALALWNAARVAYNEIDDSMAAQGYIDRLRKEFGTADSSKIITEEPPDLNIEALQ